MKSYSVRQLEVDSQNRLFDQCFLESPDVCGWESLNLKRLEFLIMELLTFQLSGATAWNTETLQTSIREF